MRLNGREIKNLSSIAEALASVDNTQVTFKHLAKATKANDKVAEFNNSDRVQDIYMNGGSPAAKDRCNPAVIRRLLEMLRSCAHYLVCSFTFPAASVQSMHSFYARNLKPILPYLFWYE
ncbi:hypothetical protein BJX99DRAFT_228681 [Aspergillus californicus]